MIKFFKLLIARIRFRFACYKADLLHDQTGKRYFVIPIGNGKLFVLNSDQRKQFIKRGIMHKSIDYIWLMQNALYYTNAKQSNNSTNMDKATARQKEQLFINNIILHSKH